MYKTAVLGKRADVLGFLALGFTAEPVADRAEAAKKLSELVKSGEYAVIFIGEDFAAELKSEIDRYSERLIPAILPIPTSSSDTGYGMNAVIESVKKAVGADII